ncbi:MAG: hypothetical protein EXR79_09875 [Myxococcales bacterium]|nr:hypothetical protein [Myxococcales bacterium]
MVMSVHYRFCGLLALAVFACSETEPSPATAIPDTGDGSAPPKFGDTSNGRNDAGARTGEETAVDAPAHDGAEPVSDGDGVGTGPETEDGIGTGPETEDGVGAGPETEDGADDLDSGPLDVADSLSEGLVDLSAPADVALATDSSSTDPGGTGGLSCAALVDCDDHDPCTADDCAQGACVHTGTSACCKADPDCDDKNPCTANQCTSSGCKFTTKTCDDGLPCTADSCSLADGHCSNTPSAGTCAIDGACRQAGQQGPTACLLCTPSTSAVAWSAIAGIPCDDGSACTSADTCTTTGTCVGTATLACCKADGGCLSADPCQTAKCDPSSGTCTFTAKPGCCMTGTCCNAATHTWKPAGALCGSALLAVDFACNGNIGMQREAFPGCDGKSAAGCSTTEPLSTWTNWKATVKCAATQRCAVAAGAPPTCLPLTPKGCTTSTDCVDGDACTSDACVGGKCVNLLKKCPDKPPCEQGVCVGSTGKCALVSNPGTCMIDSVCVAEGTAHPTDPCLACQSSVAKNAWTLAAGCTCSSGPCCDLATGKLKAHGTKCGNAPKQVAFTCSNDGTAVETRSAFEGCSGAGPLCSGEPANWAWEPWQAWKACGVGQACVPATPDQPGACESGADPLCGAKDPYEGSTSLTQSWWLGTFSDAAPPKFVGSGVHLGAPQDTDTFRWTVVDGVNGKSPSVNVTWAAPNNVIVCTYFQCNLGAKGTDCAPVQCPAGALPAAGPTISATNPNGCCLTAATGTLAWHPKAGTTWDTTGNATLTITNAAPKCQTVAVEIQFGANAAGTCVPGSTCCEPDGNYAFKATPCGAQTLGAQHKCSGPNLGGKVLTRKALAGCSGSDASCASTVSTWAWSAWQIAQACAPNEVCEVVDPTLPGLCKSKTACTPGTTCCTATGDFAPPGTKCGTVAKVVEYKCDNSTTLGAKLLVRKRFDGCIGSAVGCSDAAQLAAWSAWHAYGECEPDSACLAGSDPATPPSCGLPMPPSLCEKADPYEGPESFAAAIDLGTWHDADAAIWLDPAVHLKSAIDKDVFKFGIVDEANLFDPKPLVEWSAKQAVTVCLHFQCVNGKSGKECAPLTCPLGASAASELGAGAAVPNGCCVLAASGSLAIAPDAPGTADDSGVAFLTVKNGTEDCQGVSVKIGFGGAKSPLCVPGTTCCTAKGLWAKGATPCGAPLQKEYQCSKATAGGLALQRSLTGTCIGASPTCLPDLLTAGPWSVGTACLADEWCSASTANQPAVCKPIASGSCANACGGKAIDGSCWCDDLCAATGDCCADFSQRCGGTCAGVCGGKSKVGPCWCDGLCHATGDCCLDKGAKCGVK